MIKIMLNLFNRIYIGWAKVVIYSTHLGSNPIEVLFFTLKLFEKISN